MFERVPRPSGNPGKGGLWRLVEWAANDEKITRVGKSVAKGIVPPPPSNPFSILGINANQPGRASNQHSVSPPRRRPTKKHPAARQKKRRRSDSGDDSDVARPTSFTVTEKYPTESDRFQDSTSSNQRVDTQPVPYAPAAEGPDFMYDFTPKTNANLMETLATLALEANVPVQPMNNFSWENVPRNNGQQSNLAACKSTDWMAVLNSTNFIPYLYQQNAPKGEIAVPLLDPQVGDQTLLQATHASTDF
jgi:hypothetical protein